jgi:hypothetical protein
MVTVLMVVSEDNGWHAFEEPRYDEKFDLDYLVQHSDLIHCFREREPVEVGKVKWSRDYDAALAKSKETGKPVATLFQEAPG